MSKYQRPRLRDDLPANRRFRYMCLTQTPVGKDFLETERLLQQSLEGWESELHWALYPPVGPAPKAAWAAPSIKLSGDKPTNVYVIKFNVKATNGRVVTIFKPGLTSRPVVGGNGGRYSKMFGPEVVYERSLSPAEAWASEQKLLQTLHPSPFSRSFYDWAWYWEIWNEKVDALPKAKRGCLATYGGKDILKVRDVRDEISDIRKKIMEDAGRVLDPDSIVKAKKDSLGVTEWRTWPFSIESLIESADRIVRFCKEYQA